MHQPGRAELLKVFGLPFVMLAAGLFIFAGSRLSVARTEARSARHVRDALTDRAAHVARSAPLASLKVPSRAGFENIAEGEKLSHLIRDLQGKTGT